MPHKHTRRDQDDATYNLPPTQIAKPLKPTTISKKKEPQNQTQKNSKRNWEKTTEDAEKKTSGKRKRGKSEADDVPRAFKRAMALASGRPMRSGLDNGDAPKKGKGKAAKKVEKKAPEPVVSKPTPNDDLKIKPGERLSEFNQRVDAALPISGLVNKQIKNGKDPLGIKVKRTKKERKMQNMYAEWREMDKKVQERREEEREEAEEREMDNEAAGVTWKLDLEAQGKKKKKGKRTKYIGEEGGPEGDPWAEIKKKRNEAKVGLNEVANAPPELKFPRKNLFVRGAAVAVADIPKSAGSLRQREELQSIRNDVVESYRKMMSERRPAVAKPETD